MNLTLTQAYHRTQDLGGLIKAGESALADCEADAEAKQRIASIAVEAVAKAKANLDALKQEREDLAVHIAAEVRKVGEAVAPVEATPEPISEEFLLSVGLLQNAEGAWGSPGSNVEKHTFADFGHPLQNGADDTKVNAAFAEATNP